MGDIGLVVLAVGDLFSPHKDSWGFILSSQRQYQWLVGRRKKTYED